MPGAKRERAIPGAPAWVPGPHRGVHSPQGRRPSGSAEPPPTPRTVQCLRSPEGSSALGSEPDGFRNRVAAASALSRPHLCRLALCSPAAPRSRPGKPTLAGKEESPSPPPAVAGRLDAGEEQGSKSEEDITLCLPAHLSPWSSSSLWVSDTNLHCSVKASRPLSLDPSS
ncbi:CDC42 small effector protein 1 isoform X2 [Callithrix jacchus]|uniref:CDC42 small effector protein 1 isoform X2 n=1 Tax=Callithrix jacchus TaxID=9483 RepID=UPI0023DD6455|nr:CDC42 small effector protein 1 isoform X2 [Callithrix jacchus]